MQEDGSLLDNDYVSIEEIPYPFGRCYSVDVKKPLIAQKNFVKIHINASGSNLAGGEVNIRTKYN